MNPRALAPYAGLALGLLVVLPVAWPVPHLGDLFLLWGVGRMTLEGLSPYDSGSWHALAARYPDEVVAGAVNVIPNMAQLSGIVWPYPPWTAYAFAPFALLPPALGTGALHLAYFAAGIAAAVILARLVIGPGSPLYGVGLAAFALFEPFAIDVRAGQFATFPLLGLALVAYGVVRERTIPLVAGALLLFLKPHLFSVFALVVLVLLIRGRRWRTIAATVALLALVAAVTIARQPESLAAAFGGAADRAAAADRFATTWAVVRALEPLGDVTAIGRLVAMTTAAVAIAAAFRLPVALRLRALLAASLVASVALSPYVQAYDEVLLLPVVFVALGTVGLVGTRAARAALLALTIALGLLYPWSTVVLQMASGTQASSGFIPMLFAALLAASALAATAATRQAPTLR